MTEVVGRVCGDGRVGLPDWTGIKSEALGKGASMEKTPLTNGTVAKSVGHFLVTSGCGKAQALWEMLSLGRWSSVL